MQGPQYRDRGDGGAGQIGSDVLGNGCQAEHVDVQHLAGALRRFEINFVARGPGSSGPWIA
jgi:hypothetical protein